MLLFFARIKCHLIDAFNFKQFSIHFYLKIPFFIKKKCQVLLKKKKKKDYLYRKVLYIYIYL